MQLAQSLVEVHDGQVQRLLITVGRMHKVLNVFHVRPTAVAGLSFVKRQGIAGSANGCWWSQLCGHATQCKHAFGQTSSTAQVQGIAGNAMDACSACSQWRDIMS